MAYYTRQVTNLTRELVAPPASEDTSYLGVDVAIEYVGSAGDKTSDLQLSSTGDLTVNTGAISVIHALMRRLTTPGGGYARYYRTPSGISTNGAGLENETYSKLSSLKSAALAYEIQQYLRQAAEQDTRLSILEVKLLSDGGYASEAPMNFAITYQIGNNVYSTEYKL